MKFTKMSLVAALLMGSSAFAIDNIKVSGDAKLFYMTTDGISGYQEVKNGVLKTRGMRAENSSLFDKDASAADAALSLDITADLYKNDMVAISAGAGYTVLSTLGLENNFVSNVWGSSHTATAGTGATYASPVGGAKVENSSWMDEAWLAVTAGKTTLKLGRMELDTPLAFTETWSTEKNTFEAAVAVNQDIPDTTLVAAWVGNGNGTEAFGQNLKSNVQNFELAVGPVVNRNGEFGTYGTDGAYAFGLVNSTVKGLTVQAWYYDILKLADAYWLQADFEMDGIIAGAQYASGKVKDKGMGTALSADSDSVYALQLGYAMKDIATLKVAYSSVNDNTQSNNANLGGFGMNTATSTGQSKLYTEAWWNYGYVTQTNTDTIHVSLESPVNGLFDLGVYYTDADQGNTIGVQNPNFVGTDMTEFTVTAGKDFGPLNATLAYVYTKADDQNMDPNAVVPSKGRAYNSVQAYLTVNF
jgi:hypothetical protein